MKKYVISLFIVFTLIFSVGCEKKDSVNQLQCTKSETDEDGYQTDSVMTISSKDGKVTEVDAIVTSEMDEDMIDFTLSFGETFTKALNEIKGIQISYEKVAENKVQYHTSVHFADLDLEALQNEFGDNLDEDAFYSSKDISLDDFKEQNLSGFTCN